MRVSFYFLAALLGLMLLGCPGKSPVEVKNHALRLPDAPALINRSELGSGGNFTVGYRNGKIRSDRVFLSWQTSNDPQFLAYKIFRNSVAIRTITDRAQTSLVDSSLISNRYYLYTVAVIVEEGTSRVDTLTIKTPRVLSPANINFSILSATQVRLRWSNRMESATSFAVSRRQGAIDTLLASVTDTFYVDTTVQNNQSYTYQVVAKNDFEQSAPAQSSITVNYILNTPTITSLRQLLRLRSVEIRWSENNSTAEEGFRIYRSDPGQAFRRIATVQANVLTYVDHDTVNALAVGQNYMYRLQAFNATDTTALSAPQSLTIQQSTALLTEGFEASTSLPAGWTTSGNASWFVTSSTASEGVRSVRSGIIVNSQSTLLRVSLTAQQNLQISFDYRVSSEPGLDALVFFINGIERNRWSGESGGWRSYQTTFQANGLVILEWRYTKDGSVSIGLDAGLIDKVLVQ